MPPQFATVVYGEHDGTLRLALLALKHRGRDELARPLARMLAQRLACESWVGEIDTVSPIPSHFVLRARRGVGAAGLLAAGVARELGLPLRQCLRRRGLRRQARLTRAQRLRLPRSSFAAVRDVASRCVLVVDDVTTTGATLQVAAAALLDAGASRVACAALSYAPEPRRLT